ncbi:5'-methylthioadenosine/S-adenosylhomocysteine nucleosidase family protein [Acinetobacter ursingii]|uniref:5'-methylthioadenosine/S-adenosylhomocysteine nucleosidase family protein n=1 Tax=Acinetobacter ursingii TaxID=108980 RepID=UPI00124EA04F|nr:nucleoside phosphorylase [Acinetobacter ursingii]
MKILILEDENAKFHAIDSVIQGMDYCIETTRVVNLNSYISTINREKFDLIIADLIVPRFKDSTNSENVTESIIDETRDHACCNFRTPVIVITQFDEAAEESFKGLNQKDIVIVTYNESQIDWKESLQRKLESSIPEVSYDFIIFCALQKEADAFVELGYVSDTSEKILSSLKCTEIEINSKKGVIVTLSRMGLVSAAITVTKAIEKFKPNIVAMSGICAGIDGKANIYDVIIPSVCHQHDSGKWTSDGFIPELYDVPLAHAVEVYIDTSIKKESFKKFVKSNITLGRSEFPEGYENLEFSIKLAPTSSGSAVVASEEMTHSIMEQHRKKTAFEMESYALYEAARVSQNPPLFFSAKAVVDNGTTTKSDSFHRVACLLSAKVVYKLLEDWN